MFDIKFVLHYLMRVCAAPAEVASVGLPPCTCGLPASLGLADVTGVTDTALQQTQGTNERSGAVEWTHRSTSSYPAIRRGVPFICCAGIVT
ncbi:MAG: hypothetical protein FWC71_07570 [Defluviitaleaceae bacterium]|nr:hypothetical protein [Defluviitaleaceae bacterium]